MVNMEGAFSLELFLFQEKGTVQIQAWHKDLNIDGI
jgi:hypothetical protein